MKMSSSGVELFPIMKLAGPPGSTFRNDCLAVTPNARARAARRASVWDSSARRRLFSAAASFHLETKVDRIFSASSNLNVPGSSQK